MSDFEDYPCVGVCIDDPESGYCLGCGRPPRETGRTPPPPPIGTLPDAAATTTPSATPGPGPGTLTPP